MLGTLSGASTLTTSFLLTDSVGSVVSTIGNTVGSAAVQGNQVYGPYGNKRYSAGNMGTAKGFTGQYADDLTGFDYYVARYYDPVVARFLSADTVQGDMQGMDPYDYVGGNPETRNDPSGRCWPLCTMVIGAIVGGLIGGGVSLGSQMAAGHGVNWGEVGKQTAVGAISGAVSGLAGPEAGVLAQAAVGAASGAVGQAASNVMNNKPIGDGVGQAAAIGGVTGGLAAAAGPLVEKVGSAIVSKVGNALGSAATDAVDTAASTAAQDTSSVASDVAAAGCGGLSFSADTPVVTPDGEKAIGTLQVGDLVRAFDPATKQQSTQTVQNVFINHDNDLIDVTLALEPITNATNKAGTKQQDVAVASHGSHAPPVSGKETIHTTQKHPWLTTEGWITAGDLRLGDQVLQLDGETATVVALKVVPGKQNMYDLTVSNVHTFAVGDGEWVVHNCPASGTSGNNPNAQRGNQFHYDMTSGGPPQLQQMYPTTEFQFTPRGPAGADVHVVGGDHPSNTSVYPGSTWYPGSDYGDFKPNSWNVGSQSKFNREIRIGKLPVGTVPIWYDPIGYVISSIG